MSTDKPHASEETNPPERQWTRRDLLLRGGGTVVVAGAGALAAGLLYDPAGDAGLQQPDPIRLKDYFANVSHKPSMPHISAAYGDIEDVRRMVNASMCGLTGEQDPVVAMRHFVSRGDVVMIKPNVGFDRGPLLGATTNPDVVRALIQLCKEAGARKVVVADNPIESPAACFAKSGIKAAAEAEGASVIIHSNAHDAPVQVRAGTPDPTRHEALGTWPIFWKPLQEADKVIGVPPIKDHNLCHASMSMKNWYGLLGGRRNQFHQAIHDIVSDLGYMMKPTLIVVDGTRVMMKNGPTGGRMDDIKIGGVGNRPVVVASVDQLACDSWCVENLLGRSPDRLAYLNMAYEKFGKDPSRRVVASWKEYQGQGKVAEVVL